MLLNATSPTHLGFFSGLFKVVPEEMPYSSVEEMISLRPVELESCLPFTFTSHSKMTFDSLSLGANKALTVLSVERDKDEGDHVRCRVEGEQEASAEVRIPLSARGEFYECESEECFTLKEIMSSPCLLSRRFRFVKTTKCERLLVLSPVYQVHAVMNCENALLLFIYCFTNQIEIEIIETFICLPKRTHIFHLQVQHQVKVKYFFTVHILFCITLDLRSLCFI